VFTARYALSPYIKQIRFVFKGLNRSSARRPTCDSDLTHVTSIPKTTFHILLHIWYAVYKCTPTYLKRRNWNRLTFCGRELRGLTLREEHCRCVRTKWSGECLNLSGWKWQALRECDIITPHFINYYYHNQMKDHETERSSVPVRHSTFSPLLPPKKG
jgi:hypothetical protein